MTLTTADVWLLLALAWSVLVGYWLWELFDHCRRARRLAKAELAFWESLQRLVDKAREDIERPASQVASVKRMREQIADNECRRLMADIDAWERES